MKRADAKATLCAVAVYRAYHVRVIPFSRVQRCSVQCYQCMRVVNPRETKTKKNRALRASSAPHTENFGVFRASPLYKGWEIKAELEASVNPRSSVMFLLPYLVAQHVRCYLKETDSD